MLVSCWLRGRGLGSAESSCRPRCQRALLQSISVIWLLGAPSAAIGADRGVAYLGASAGGGPSAYIGVLRAAPGYELGQGLAVSVSAGQSWYHYEAETGRVRASSSDLAVGLVYSFSGDWGWLNLSAGPRLNRLRLAGRDPNNADLGTHLTVGVGARGILNLDATRRLHVASDFSLRNRGYDATVGLGQRMGRTLGSELGIEVGLSGDRNYRAAKAGVFASRKLSRDLEGQISFGAKRDGGLTKPYVSLDLNFAF